MTRRTRVRPFGASIPAGRTLSLMLLLFIVGVCILRARQPGLWTWMAVDDSRHMVLAAADRPQNQKIITEKIITAQKATIQTSATSQVINNTLPEEWSSFENEIQPIEDRLALQQTDMPAYWRLMTWAKNESFLDLLQRASPDVLFVNLWEEPERYRGKPIRLRLNIRRVLSYNAGENELGVQQLYEAWGWTTDSKSFPYVVVFRDLPEGLPMGADVHAEVEFAGYFLKVMAYDAYETRRGAPLLIGQLRLVKPTHTDVPAFPKLREVLLWSSGLLTMIGIAIAVGIRRFRNSHPQTAEVTTDTPHETPQSSLHEPDHPTVASPPFAQSPPFAPEQPPENLPPPQRLSDQEKTSALSKDQPWFPVSDSAVQSPGGIDVFSQPARGSQLPPQE